MERPEIPSGLFDSIAGCDDIKEAFRVAQTEARLRIDSFPRVREPLIRRRLFGTLAHLSEETYVGLNRRRVLDAEGVQDVSSGRRRRRVGSTTDLEGPKHEVVAPAPAVLGLITFDPFDREFVNFDLPLALLLRAEPARLEVVHELVEGPQEGQEVNVSLRHAIARP